MSGSRVSGARRKTSRKAPEVGAEKPNRFIGLSLSGGKSDKACVAVVEYFPEHKKIFLARLYEKIKTEEFISADLKIHEIITQFHDEIDSIAFDVPLTLPACVNCKLKCPGYETCSVSQMEWMRNFYNEVNKQKKPKKMFTPYTQRCVEAYIAHGLEENFEIHHALGSNLAPLTARAQFIHRRLHLPAIEVFPRLTIWRLGQELRVAKSHLKFHKHAVGGDESRKAFLQALAERKGVFIYQQDLKAMIENNHAFEAFVCAYTGFLKHMKQTESRPADFPKGEAWIEFPK
jgi:hypothetical protein